MATKGDIARRREIRKLEAKRDELGLPCIPVFNSSNRATTFVDAAGNENATTYSLGVLLAELVGVRRW